MLSVFFVSIYLHVVKFKEDFHITYIKSGALSGGHTTHALHQPRLETGRSKILFKKKLSSGMVVLV